MFQTLADMATMRALLEAAERESAAMGEADPGAEHVVLAALALPDRTAANALAELGADASQLRAAIVQVHAEALAALGISEPPQATSRSAPANRGVYRSKGSTQDLLIATAKARKALGAKRFASAHVLIGATTLEHGTLPMALRRLGDGRHNPPSHRRAPRRTRGVTGVYPSSSGPLSHRHRRLDCLTAPARKAERERVESSPPSSARPALVAQGIEQRFPKPCAGSSILPGGTTWRSHGRELPSDGAAVRPSAFTAQTSKRCSPLDSPWTSRTPTGADTRGPRDGTKVPSHGGARVAP